MGKVAEIIGGIFTTKKERDAHRDRHKRSRQVRSDDPDPEDATDRVFVWRVTRRWWRSGSDDNLPDAG